MTLYIKTDGPVPEGSGYKTGMLYSVVHIRGGYSGAWFIDPNRLKAFTSLGKASAHLDETASFYLCDEHGNPISDKPEPALIDWQAHAEALAEALRAAYPWIETSVEGEEATRIAKKALSAFNQAKG